MRIYSVPYYCGGRFLAGLYNTPNNRQWDIPGYLLEKVRVQHGLRPAAYTNDADEYPYVPRTLLEFQQILKILLSVGTNKDAGIQGVVYAVTNSEETQAPAFLEASGFKSHGKFTKHSAYGLCTTWIGDYRDVMFPILSKVPDFQMPGVKSESKFKIESERHPSARPWATETGPTIQPVEMQNAVRRSQEQMVRTLHSGQSATGVRQEISSAFD